MDLYAKQDLPNVEYFIERYHEQNELGHDPRISDLAEALNETFRSKLVSDRIKADPELYDRVLERYGSMFIFEAGMIVGMLEAEGRE